MGLPHGLRSLHREPGRELPSPSHLLLESHTRPAAPVPGVTSRVRPWRPCGRPSSPAASTRPRAGRALGPGALQPAACAGPAPAPPPVLSGAERLRPGAALEGASVGVPLPHSLPPFPLGAGLLLEYPVPKALLPRGQGRCESPKVPSKPAHSGCCIPNSDRLSGHHCQTAPFT